MSQQLTAKRAMSLYMAAQRGIDEWRETDPNDERIGPAYEAVSIFYQRYIRKETKQ